MNNISFYLDKYSNIGLKERQIKNSIIEAIISACGIIVDKDDIIITDKNLKINIQGSQKTEIFIHTNLVQKKFSENLDKYNHKLDKKKIF